jgi:25S rRNA (adenine2142-N1)-methyltransferase
LEKLGGLAAYQEASRRGEVQRGSLQNTSKWVLGQLETLDRRPAASRKLRLLDVGALAANYTRQLSWIAPRAIDLRASAPGVEAIDFFTLEDPVMYDVVVLSLVVNFVGDAHLRGVMLHKATQHLAPNGLVFLVLPLACVDNSRNCNESLLRQILEGVGLTVRHVHRSKSLFYVALELCGPAVDAACLPTITRQTVRAGAACNNFSIVLGPAVKKQK